MYAVRDMKGNLLIFSIKKNCKRNFSFGMKSRRASNTNIANGIRIHETDRTLAACRLSRIIQLFCPNQRSLGCLEMARKDSFPGGGGGGTPIYELFRYVPRDRVWFLRSLILISVSFCPCWNRVPGVILRYCLNCVS